MAKKSKSVRSTNHIDVEIGNRLRALRMDRELSQDKVADALKVSFQQVQKYEKGTNRLSVGRLLQFCEILKSNPVEILGWGNKSVAATIDPETFKLVRSFESLRDDWKPPIRQLILKMIEIEAK
jgi:transcriptional regulator with XRE-family HTH domain